MERRIFLAGLAGAALSTPALAQKLPNRIDYLIGSKTGGGYDRYARLIGKHMEEYLDGIQIVPLNKPAGAGVPALNAMARADADGGTMMTYNTGHLLGQIANATRVKVDLGTLSYIGKASAETRLLIMRPDLGVEKIDDLRHAGEPFLFTTSGVGGASHVQASILRDAFELNIRVLPGFSGGEIRAALAKGEASGLVTSESNLQKIVDGNYGVPILRFGPSTIPSIAALPNAEDIAANDIQKAVSTLIRVHSNLGRLTAAAPNTPEPILAQLRTAFDSTMSDAAFIAEAQDQNLPLSPKPGAQVAKEVNSLLDANDDVRAMLQKVFQV